MHKRKYNICHLKYSVTKKNPIAFHNGSNYNYHFIIKELAEEFEKQLFTCLGENIKKYITFTVPIEKAVTIGEVEKKSQKYILKITIYWKCKIYGKLINKPRQ